MNFASAAFRRPVRGEELTPYEAIIDDERRKNAFGLMMSLNMLIETRGGFDYTGADCSAWLKEDGFGHISTFGGAELGCVAALKTLEICGRSETRAMVRELKPLIRPEHMVLVEKDGRPIAVTLVLPNLYDIVGDLGGSPSPIGWVKFVRRLLGHRFRSGRVILLGVRAELRGSMLGAVLPSLMIGELMIRGRRMPLRSVELGWILEDNLPMRRLIEQLTPKPTKVFRIYEAPIG